MKNHSLVFALVYLLSCGGVGLEVPLLNQELKARRAEWTARENWLTRQGFIQNQAIMGLKEVPGPEVEFVRSAPPSSQQLPSHFDWRNKDGKNWVSPISNQGNCGACVAFATVGALETQINISSLTANLNVRLSPQNFFSCGGGECRFGWILQQALYQLLSKGIPDEACLPYTSGASGKDVACRQSCSDSSARSLKVLDYSSPTKGSSDIQALKQALLRGPLITTMTVYEDFLAYGEGVYKHLKGPALGGHAVSIVGYDDATASFIIRNSWGDDWGERGFAHVSYSDVSGIGKSTWALQVPSLSAGVTGQLYPRNYAYLSGQVTLRAQTNLHDASRLTSEIMDSTSTVVWSNSCEIDRPDYECRLLMDTRLLQDGRYEIESSVYNTSGQRIGKSTRQFFYVVNQTPRLGLRVQGKNIDLNQSVKGRIEFEVFTESSSVPFSALEFHYKKSGEPEHQRLEEVVLPKMTVGWRTNLIPNGSYEIWFTGRVKSDLIDAKVETSHMTINLKN